MATADRVHEQGRLARLLVEQCAWRGIEAPVAALLDALGMAGLVLAEHGDPYALSPATVAAILEVIDAPEAATQADVISLDDVRRSAAARARRC